MSYYVTVKFDNKSFSLPFRPTWTVARFKESIARNRNVSPGQIRIIFAGEELPNHFTLQNCQLNHSVVHAVRNENGYQDPTLIEGNSLTNISLSHYNETQSSFFVFCKHCNKVTRGKLRCKCSRCGQGSFILLQGPSCWDDVLIKERMSGRCQSNNDCHNTIAKFYFKCGEHQSEDEQSPLPMLKANTRNIPCIICDTDNADLVLVFPCQIQHTICVDCFVRYCSVYLNERRFIQTEEHGYSIACPGNFDDCQTAFIKDPHHFRLMGDDQYERYQRFAAEEFLRSEGGIFCPRPDCGQGIFASTATRRVVCEYGCGLVFCRLCLRNYHEGECPVDDVIGATALENTELDRFQVTEFSNERAIWNEQSEQQIQRTTKRCPNINCKAPTEKNV
ncbi:E3 ubiquitin-protein ligase parkin-like isoform X2 [Xenia sp. Carnegie-2017]|uniref:E3 ubiquitin-protein ligase parkin-like isoform X2 n=1 Tax=Xenia sp. Carnegie-2017 TaxID=2897299 RepID=UPI001F03934C|nr:E3 ubiquitin-protein ligase parkin-like isoform X2 [Xenia sp. Carnegie-2017]